MEEGMQRRPIFERALHREADENLTSYEGRGTDKIGVVGLSSGAGVTLMAFAAARYIANMKQQVPAVLEVSDGNEGLSGWMYDAIGIERRFSGREYHSLHRMAAEGRDIKKATNMDEGINWALRVPTEAECALDMQQMTSLVNNVAGDVTICDFSSRLSFGAPDEDARLERLKRLLREMSLIVIVVNPSPSKLLGGNKRLSMAKELESCGAKVLYVINMFGRGVNKRELYNYLKPKEKAVVELMCADEIYEAEYNCKNPFQMPSVKKAVSGAIEAALARL
jgi:hypothetical protein